MKSDTPTFNKTSAEPVASARGETKTVALEVLVRTEASSPAMLICLTSSIPFTVINEPPAIGPQLGDKNARLYESDDRCRMIPLDVKSCALLLISTETFPLSLGLAEHTAFEDVIQIAADAFIHNPTLQNKLSLAKPEPITVIPV